VRNRDDAARGDREQPRCVAHQAGRLALGPTMKPGVSHSETTGSPNTYAQLEEPRELVARIGV